MMRRRVREPRCRQDADRFETSVRFFSRRSASFIVHFRGTLDAWLEAVHAKIPSGYF